MNLALATIVIGILALPGLTVRRSYFSGVFSRSYVRLPLADEIFFSLALAAPFHGVGAAVASFVGRPVDFDLLLRFLAGGLEKGSRGFGDVSTVVRGNIGAFVAYQALTCGLAFVLGHGWRMVVRRRRLDRRFRLFRFENHWHYLLTAEILDFPGEQGDPDSVEFVWIDALVEVGGEGVIYSGIFEQYQLGRDGTLDKVYLSYAERVHIRGLLPSGQPGPGSRSETIADPGKPETGPVPGGVARPALRAPVRGDYLVLPAERILNLNVVYLRLGASE